MVNSQGVVFVTRLMAETGAEPDRIVSAYRTARVVTDAVERWQAVEALFGSISPELTRLLLADVDGLVEDVTRWYLGHPESRPVGDRVEETTLSLRELANAIQEIGPKEWRAERDAESQELVAVGVPKAIARRHVYQGELAHAPAIIDVAALTGRTVREVAEAFLRVGAVFDIDWLEQQVARFPAATRWHRRAVRVADDDLALLRRELAELVLTSHPDVKVKAAVKKYLEARPAALHRLRQFLRALAIDGVDDVASVFVATRRIRALAGSA